MALVYSPDIYLYNHYGHNIQVDDLIFPYIYSFVPIVIAARSQYTSLDSLLTAAAAAQGTQDSLKMCTVDFYSTGYLIHKALEKADKRAKYLELVKCNSSYEPLTSDDAEEAAAAGYVGLPTAIANRDNKKLNFLAVSGKYLITDLPDTKLLSYLGFGGTDLTGLRGFAVNKNVSASVITELTEKLHKAHKVNNI